MGDIELSQIVQFRIEKTEGLYLTLRHGFARCYVGWIAVPDQTIDLTSHVPSSGAWVVLICLSAFGSIHLIDGTAKGSRAELRTTDIPATPTQEVPVAIVLLEAGQTEITMDTDVTDVGSLRAMLYPPEGFYATGAHDHALDDLTDVNASGPANDEALSWDQASSKWEPKAVLGFSGLSKITVSATEPTSPTAGDLWVDIS